MPKLSQMAAVSASRVRKREAVPMAEKRIPMITLSERFFMELYIQAKHSPQAARSRCKLHK